MLFYIALTHNLEHVILEQQENFFISFVMLFAKQIREDKFFNYV